MSKDLRKLTNKWHKKVIRNLETWKKYQRDFLTISGWLLKKKKITVADEAARFWHGIHKSLQRIIENRYLAQHPDSDMSEPIEMYEVDKIAKVQFARYKFARNLEDSDSDQESETGTESSSDSDSDSIFDSKAFKMTCSDSFVMK